jgi:ABC-type transport system substrate-binding protein
VLLLPLPAEASNVEDDLVVGIQSSKTMAIRPLDPIERDFMSIYDLMYDGLMVINDDYLPECALAESYSHSGKTWTFKLRDDLFFSDGTKITAWDYAFAVLFQAAPEVAETGGLPMDLSYLKGYEEYISGECKYLEGVHVISDLLIEFTVKHEYLPYFFELYRMCFCPFPIYEIAPGCKVYDDGEGCYIGNEDPSIPERIFSAKLIEETVMDPENGYLAYPTVGSGPYVLTGWDQETFTCTFEINPYFKGDWEGNKPTIPKLRYTLARNEDMVDLLREDKFQLLNKVTRQDSIINGI